MTERLGPLGQGAAFSGLKVVELAQLIAAPMAASFLADFGADVVHVEDPIHGDPQRVTGVAKDGTYLWWKVSARNKRSVTLDLRTPKGQEIARRLAAWADVVITSFRPNTLEGWGLDWPSLHEMNERLIMLQISGYGTDTALRNEPGFGKVGEAMSGVVQITGFPDGPPLHTGFSHGDSLTGLMGAFAVGAALHRRAADPNFDGEWIDLALFETLYRLIEWQVIVHDQLGVVPTRAGNSLPISPAAVINSYQSSEGEWITVTSGTPKSVRKVAALLSEPPEDYETVDQQQARREHLDTLLRDWVRQRTTHDAVAAMRAAEVVASKIFTMADIANDPTYAERGDVITVHDDELGDVRMQGVIPKLANHGGHVWRAGPSLGEDNELVYRKFLGLGEDEVSALRADGTI